MELQELRKAVDTLKVRDDFDQRKKQQMDDISVLRQGRKLVCNAEQFRSSTEPHYG